MIVDDSEMDNLLNKIILQKLKFSENIHIYNNPEEALEDLKQGKCKPEIILVDINMPHMTGFEFVEALEQLPKLIPAPVLYMISSSDDSEDIEKARGYKSVVKYIKKPLDQEDLLN